MGYEPEKPSEKADDEMRRRGLEQDKNDPNTYRDNRGGNGGEADGDWIKTGQSWERIR